MKEESIKFQEGGFRSWLSKLIGVTFGPAIILLAFGQATGELIHWPYLVVKYNTLFLWLIIPACAIQFPIFSFLAKQTMLTGESFFGALSKRSWFLSSFFWAVFFLTSIWIGSYTTAGGFALVELAQELGLSITDKAQISNYAAWGINFVFFIILIYRGRSYSIVTTFTSFISLSSIIIIGILFIYTTGEFGFSRSFFSSLVVPSGSGLIEGISRTDANLVLTAIIFAGLGGFWNVLYSSWIRNENIGVTRVQSVGDENASDEYLEYQQSEPPLQLIDNLREKYRSAIRLVHTDLGFALGANALMLIALAYVTYVFYPDSANIPQDIEIITTLADSASNVSHFVGLIFYFLIGIFLVDTWLTAADSLSKVHSNFVVGILDRIGILEKSQHVKAVRIGYVSFLVFMYVMTIVSTLVAPPQVLIFLNGVMSGLGSVLLIVGIFIIEYSLRRKYDIYPSSKWLDAFLVVSFLVYVCLAVLYLIS